LFSDGKGTKKNETTKEKRDFFAFKLIFYVFYLMFCSNLPFACNFVTREIANLKRPFLQAFQNSRQLLQICVTEIWRM